MGWSVSESDQGMVLGLGSIGGIRELREMGLGNSLGLMVLFPGLLASLGKCW